MKRAFLKTGRGLAVLAALWAAAPFAAQAREASLPQVLRIDVLRLEETWNILDRFAARIWPGWTGYRDVPFLFEYPNGMEMLIGHPSPPDDFELVAGFEVQGKKVYLNRKREIPLDMNPPFLGGGGPNPYGKTQRVQTVWLKMAEAKATNEDPYLKNAAPRPAEHLVSGEKQILINIHELFHVFQRTVYNWRYGNLQFNTDANYAVYADVEGRALEKAALESDAAKAREYLEDFSVARERKRTSMNTAEANQESEEDLMEGTAVYAETRALELIRDGYQPFITPAQDPHFLGFRLVGLLIEDKYEQLRTSRARTLDARGKCYWAGNAQALLLTRLFPGWQENFFQGGGLLDKAIAAKLALTARQKAAVAARLRDRYKIGELEKEHGRVVRGRDDALRLFQNRTGRVYIINLKPAGEYLNLGSRGEIYEVGLMRLAPQGIQDFAIRDVAFEGSVSPILQDQLYYLKWIDAASQAGEKGYTLTYAKKDGEDVFVDAVFKTAGFTLKAPKIRVQDTPARVKVTVLEKLRPGK